MKEVIGDYILAYFGPDTKLKKSVFAKIVVLLTKFIYKKIELSNPSKKNLLDENYITT
jgi:hypothetical protein